MTKSKRREDVLAIGTVILLLGAVAVYDGATKPLALNTLGIQVAEFIGGGFLVVIGAYLCALGVSDEAGKNASKFLKAIFNRFLEALGK